MVKIISADGIYTKASEDFQKGPLKDLSRCIKAEKNDAAAIITYGGASGKLHKFRIADRRTLGQATRHKSQGLRHGRTSTHGSHFGGGCQEVKIAEVYIGAMRGRNPENPSDRTAGAPTEQRLEINEKGLCNTITTVQKDNIAVEISQYPRGKNKGGILNTPLCPTITSNAFEKNTRIAIRLADGTIIRVRQLTPRECWRLMNQTDKDYDKARTALISTHYKGKDKANTQLYRQAGNSIVVNLLSEVFSNIKGIEKKYSRRGQ